jgi:hypothetical protein
VNRLSEPRQAEFFGDMLRRARYPIHFHCWQPDDLVELFDRLRSETRTPFRVLDADLPEAQDEFAFLLEREAQ